MHLALRQHQARTCLAALSVAVLCVLPANTHAQSTGIQNRNATVSDSADGGTFKPSSGARIAQGFRSRSAGHAPALTVRRSARRAGRGPRVYVGRVCDGGGFEEEHSSNWFPRLIAAPFLLPWYLLGGGYGHRPCDEDPWAIDPYPAYPGPSTTFSAPLGQSCATPQKTCRLYQPAEVGLRCSCRAPAGYGRFRGAVVP